MEIIVEIGTPEQQALVRQEIQSFLDVASQLKLPRPIIKVVIPGDFQESVRSLTSNDRYNSTRAVGDHSITVMAKIIDTDEGVVITLSPDLYTAWQDSSTRAFMFFHEVIHVRNKELLPELEIDGPVTTEMQYLGNLRKLFDEYVADRLAYKVVSIMFNPPSPFWENFLSASAEGFRDTYQAKSYYDAILSEVEKFRYHADVDRFLQQIKPSLDNVAILTAHAFAFVHQFPDKLNLVDSSGGFFLAASTVALYEYFKNKFDEKDYDLSDGCEIIARYFELFGFRFEDREHGLYCHVLDI